MLSSPSMWEMYPKLIEECKTYGNIFTPREFSCLELRPHSFCITNPRLALYNGMRRRLNYRFFAVETLGYLAGLDEPWYMDLLCDANSQFEKFRRAEDNGLEWGYGPRLKQSLQEVVEQLTKDPSSRQCVCSIWDPGINNKICSNTPCTVMLHFFSQKAYKKDRLSLQVYMRSNDLDWGTPYDVPAFCILQMAVASCLGWEVGKYYHTAGSLHLYEDHIPDAPGVDGREKQLLELQPLPMYEDSITMMELQERSEGFLIDLADHRKNEKPWKEFTTDFEETYFKFWQDLVRFNWVGIE